MDPLLFEYIRINRMPGLDGVLELNALKPGINIVYGPNAAGKTSLALALNRVLWPGGIQRKGRPMALEAGFRVGDSVWRAELDGAYRAYQQDGTDRDGPDIPVSEFSEGYNLALHELLLKTDHDFAAHIIQEMQGGFNLEEAGRKVGAREQFRNRSIAAYRAYEQKLREYNEVTDRQSKLKEEERQLSRLQDEEKELRQKMRRAECCRLAAEREESRQQYSGLQEQLQEWPEMLAEMDGKEPERAEELNRKIGALDRQLSDLNTKISDHHRLLQESGLQEAQLDRQVLECLQQQVETLRDNRDRLVECDKQLEGLQEQMQQCLQSVNIEVDEQKLESLDEEVIGKIRGYVRRADDLQSRRKDLETRLSGLGMDAAEGVEAEGEAVSEGAQAPDDGGEHGDSSKRGDSASRKTVGDGAGKESSARAASSVHPEQDPEAVKKAMDQLIGWLKVPAHQGQGIRPAVACGVLALSTAAALMTLFAGWTGLLALALPAGLLVWEWWRVRFGATGQADTRVYEREFRDTGCAPPSAWQTDEVRNRLEDLTRHWVELRARQRDREQARQLKQELRQLGRKEQQVEQLRRDLTAQTGVELETDSDVQMAWIYETLWCYQQARIKHQAAWKEREQVAGKMSQCLEELSDTLQRCGMSTAGSYEEAATAVRDLDTRYHKYEQAKKDLEHSQEIYKQKSEEYRERLENRRHLFEQLGLEDGDMETLRQRAGQLEPYRELQKQVHQAGWQFEELNRKLQQHEAFDPELLQTPLEQLRSDSDPEDRLRKQYQEVRDRLARTQDRIERAMESDDLESAYAEWQQALDALARERDQDLFGATANELIQWLRGVNKQVSYPEVFHHADELLTRITRGRYRLDVDEEEETFQAYDSRLERWQHMEQLSSGTRMQMLLAVRLAFIATQEQGVRLPFFADELLANSDDLRAQAIIRALSEAASEGRQLFYFTAQQDEVTKWQHIVEQNEKSVPLTVHRLEPGRSDSKQSGSSGGVFAGFDTGISLAGPVPPPEGRSHRDYAELIGVPVFNPVAEGVDRLHLWYLISDPQKLYYCLKLGLERWGELHNLADRGDDLPGIEVGDITVWRQRAQLIQRAINLYRRGRPVPIDSRVIEDSGAVTSTFRNAVMEQLREVDGDPVRLLEKIEQIPRFQKAKKQELQEYLEQNGYLPQESPLDREAFQRELQLETGKLDLDAREAQQLVNRLFAGGQAGDNQAGGK